MGIIYTEFDNKLEKSEIIMPLLSSSTSEAGEDYLNARMTDKAQTNIIGTQMPIIMINNTVVDFNHILRFKISSKSILPTLSLAIEDKFGIIKNIDTPNIDNEVRIQILPKFENAYKKINLTFYITDIKMRGNGEISLHGVYKLPALTSSQFKSFGKIDTYSLFKNIAIETKLGFATNIAAMSDNRYVYCDNKSFLELLNNEINYADTSTHVLDWWIDYWDNINLVDIKERYNTIDPDEDMQIWVTGQTLETTADQEIVPSLAPAVINDYPGFNGSELFVTYHTVKTNPGINLVGTDKVYGIYNDAAGDSQDFFIQNSNVNKDVFVSYNYMGENYGTHNYIWSKCVRNSLLANMNLETVTVTMNTPVLALMRGHKVNFIHYVNNEKIENRLQVLEENNIIDRKSINSNIPLDRYDFTKYNKSNNGNFVIDKTISAQYLITGVDIIYNYNTWRYELTLVKNLNSKVTLV